MSGNCTSLWLWNFSSFPRHLEYFKLSLKRPPFCLHDKQSPKLNVLATLKLDTTPEILQLLGIFHIIDVWPWELDQKSSNPLEWESPWRLKTSHSRLHCWLSTSSAKCNEELEGEVIRASVWEGEEFGKNWLDSEENPLLNRAGCFLRVLGGTEISKQGWGTMPDSDVVLGHLILFFILIFHCCRLLPWVMDIIFSYDVKGLWGLTH